MARLLQFQNAVIGKKGRKGFHIGGKIGFCKVKIQRGTDDVVAADSICPGAAFCTQLCNDALDFLLFLAFQYPDVIVGFHNGHRFYKEGLTGCRGIMHQTGNGTSVLCLYRQYESAVTQGHPVILQAVLDGLFAHHVVQGIPELLLRLVFLAANGGQGAAGTVCQFLFGEDGTIQLFQQIGERCQLREPFL